MLEYIIASTIKLLVVAITGLKWFFYGTDEDVYKHINQTIIDGNVVNVSLVIIEGKYGTIDSDDYSCHA